MSQTEPLAELVKSKQIQQIEVWEADTCRFLRFPLGEETTGLLSLERLVEVIEVRPKEILPIPELPKYLLGIANRRGEAIWIVDLFYLMGATPLHCRELIPEVCMAILVQAQEQAIGLLVEQVSSLEVYNLKNLQPFTAQTLPSRLLSFLEGYFVDSEGNTLALLNVDTIIEKVENLDREI
ncbi:putative CheW protein [Hyella patelloides LEGE 07179]|uniref:Putative CheW protein n=1 Tax=Hyella patelloides LEGE 07179 TaxID=945734 RepID=A0A563VPT5_9CYAN|nr:chemotaxis protein CheW [Hyella patelloides]VEP13414.1 putative CheW protein [Hyella patelloides LEGE 07179]